YSQNSAAQIHLQTLMPRSPARHRTIRAPWLLLQCREPLCCRIPPLQPEGNRGQFIIIIHENKNPALARPNSSKTAVNESQPLFSDLSAFAPVPRNFVDAHALGTGVIDQDELPKLRIKRLRSNAPKCTFQPVDIRIMRRDHNRNADVHAFSP